MHPPACHNIVYLPVYNIIGITVGFSTDNVSLNIDEASGTVTLNVKVLNGTISERNTVQIRVTTADNSAHGMKQQLKL